MRYVNLYHQQLSYCVTQFVEKDPKLAIQVIESILAFWPMTYSPKEVLFLNEAEEILEMIQASELTLTLTLTLALTLTLTLTLTLPLPLTLTLTRRASSRRSWRLSSSRSPDA